MVMGSITLYGDSVLRGVTLAEGKYILDSSSQEEFTRERGISVRNLCRFGATVEKGLGLIRRDLSLHGAPEGLAILEYGGNDSDFAWAEVAAEPWAEHQCKTPMGLFRRLYGEAVQLLRQAGARPVAAIPIPVDPERYLRWICRDGLSRERILEWLGDVTAIYRWEEWYALAVRDVAESMDVPVIDLRQAFLARRRMDGLLCEDGIHPTAEGRKLIFDTFGRALDAAATA